MATQAVVGNTQQGSVAFSNLSIQSKPYIVGYAVGRGLGRVEFEGMRVPMGESRARFLEALEVVRRALRDEQFSFNGEYYQVPSMSLRPRRHW